MTNVRMSDRRLTVTENGHMVVGGGVILAYSTAGCNRNFSLLVRVTSWLTGCPEYDRIEPKNMTEWKFKI